jgi:hypothetical protein
LQVVQRIVRFFEGIAAHADLALYEAESYLFFDIGGEFASLVAGQVVNYLKGEDIAAVTENPTEPPTGPEFPEAVTLGKYEELYRRWRSTHTSAK